MRRWLISCLAAALGCASALADEAAPQSDRRDRLAPELVVESGGRRGACDVLTFTRDGQHLLAAGDDKVVRVWEWRDGRAAATSKVLRWSVWGEKRGAIYALAVSPDPQGKRVAVGGLGLKNTAAAVIDRLSGEVLHTVYATDKKLRFGSVRAIAFSPRGDRVAFGSADGSVWLWRPEAKEESWLTRLGRHEPIPGAEFNFIRLVRFLDDKRLLSVAESGEARRWHLTADEPTHERIPIFDDLKTPLFSVALSDDGKWLAATAKKKPLVAVRSLAGKERKDIDLAAGSVAVSAAFDGEGRRLAVGIRPPPTNQNGFYLEGDERICLYDLSMDKPTPHDGPKHSWRVDSLVFHPDGEHLGVAGGDNHEVKIWDLNNLKEPANVLRGVGTGLWGVALSKDGRSLAFQTRRKPEPTHPNQRGQGPWTVFDLEEREFRPNETAFAPLKQLEKQDGWRIVGDRDSYVWWIVHDDKNIKPRQLPLDKKRYERPTCYAFLPRVEGRSVRVAVGHYNGVSVYDVTAEGVRRTWLGEGHEGEVMSLAVSADGDWLVSASNDQTISAWSLRKRPSGSELGARFRADGGRVFLTAVDPHGPAWEAGLKVGDELVGLGVQRRKVFVRPGAGRSEPPLGSAETCRKALADAEPGQVLDFSVRRPGHDRPIASFTTLPRRPLWRFFPTRDKEWVLWMWGYCYYDTSNNGDDYIGWQMNNAADVRKTPAFYRAKQFHNRFHRQDILDILLKERDVRRTLVESRVPLEPPNFAAFDSVRVRIEPRDEQVKDKDLEVVLNIEPRTYHADYVPVRAELWVNDRRLQVWPLNGKSWRTTWTIPREQLRVGDNDLTLQCYNNVEGRGEGWLEASARVVCDRRPNLPKLYGLVVGLNDYNRSAPGKNGTPVLHNLTTPRRDAESMRDAWLAQKHLLYADVQVDLLPEGGATVGRATILKKLEQLAARAGPDDRVFLFFAGHGETLVQGNRKRFVFCCPDFDPARPDETSVGARDLYEALAKVPGRKVVFLDACRAGHVAGQPARDLTPGGRGPIILAACDRGESSYEIKGAPHAVFATAILEAMGKRFARADQNGDGRLDAWELYEYTARRVPELLKEARVSVVQTPARSPAQLSRYPLLAGKPPAEK